MEGGLQVAWAPPKSQDSTAGLQSLTDGPCDPVSCKLEDHRSPLSISRVQRSRFPACFHDATIGESVPRALAKQKCSLQGREEAASLLAIVSIFTTKVEQEEGTGKPDHPPGFAPLRSHAQARSA